MLIRLLAKRWVQILLLLMLLTTAVLLRLQDPAAITRLRLMTFDYYNKILPRVPGDQVVIVDIDEDSIAKHGQWPWPRPLIAELPVILREMGAKSVVFDMVFAEPDRTSPSRAAQYIPETPEMLPVRDTLAALPDNDAVFADKIAQTGGVVTGFAGANQKTGHQPIAKAKFLNTGIKPDALKFVNAVQDFTVTLPLITEKADGNGSFMIIPETDGIVRRVPLLIGQADETGKALSYYPALSLEALRVAMGKSIYKVTSFGEPSAQGYGIRSVTVGDYEVPTDEKGNIWVYYTGHRPDIYIPAADILDRSVNPLAIKDKIVFVGTSAIGLLDLRASPFKADLPGVEIHAEIVEQILDGKFLQRPDFLEGAELIAVIGLSLCIIFLSPFIGTGMLAFIALVLILGGGFGGLFAYQKFGYLVDPVYPSMAILMIFIVSSVLTNLRTEMEKRAVRQAFSHYISPVLMEELASNPDKLRLGGEVRELSVMFTDIRNFTTISEGMDPGDLIRMMNDFLTPMTSCVLENRGTVDKYMGDAMMAFWNAPLDDPDHARNACRTALGMVAALKPVNEALKAEAALKGRTFRELKAGIGIHTGRASVGNMGSKQRFAYSALGDTVNLASRLEGQTKGYGISIMLSEKTRLAAPELAAIELDLLTVKGRSEPERIFALLGDDKMAQEPSFQAFAARHDSMLNAYRIKNWDQAEKLASECAHDRPEIEGLYALYKSRIAEFRQTPPADNWGGVYVAKEK